MRLWIHKIKEKTKLRETTTDIEGTCSRECVAFSKYRYTKVSHGETRHSLKGLGRVY
jgi:hypothetical protein